MNLIKKLRDYYRITRINQETILKTIEENNRQLKELNRILDEHISLTSNNLNIASESIKNISSIIDKSNLEYTNLELLSSASDSDKKLKVLLCGFYAGDNIGDELMLQTLLSYLQNYDNLNITVMLDYNNKYNVLKNVRNDINYIHYPKSNYDLLKLSSKYDKLIFGGGALIDDKVYYNDPFKLSLSNILIDLTICFIDNKKDVYWIGLSSNHQLNNKLFIKRLNYIVQNVKYISFRDSFSIETLKEQNIKINNIKLVDDIVLSNNLLYKPIINENNNKIGLILIWNNDLYQTNKKIIKGLLKYLNQNDLSLKIDLIPFYDYVNNDVNYCKKIVDEINDERIDFLEFESDFENVVSTIDQYKYIISMRYHASLLSIIRNKRLLTIHYTNHPHYKNKLSYLYERFANDDNICSSSEIVNSKNINKIFDKLFKNNYNPPKNINVILEDSEKQMLDVIKQIAE